MSSLVPPKPLQKQQQQRYYEVEAILAYEEYTPNNYCWTVKWKGWRDTTRQLITDFAPDPSILIRFHEAQSLQDCWEEVQKHIKMIHYVRQYFQIIPQVAHPDQFLTVKTQPKVVAMTQVDFLVAVLDVIHPPPSKAFLPVPSKVSTILQSSFSSPYVSLF